MPVVVWSLPSPACLSFVFFPLQTVGWDAVPSEGEVGPASQDKPQGPENSEVPADLPPDTRSVLAPAHTPLCAFAVSVCSSWVLGQRLCREVLTPLFWFPTVCSRRLPRPGSARPAPPRVKRQDSAEVLAADR